MTSHTVFLFQSRNEFLWRIDADAFFLRRESGKEVHETAEQILFLSQKTSATDDRRPGCERPAFEHLLSERNAEEERLQHRIAVARVAELENGSGESDDDKVTSRRRGDTFRLLTFVRPKKRSLLGKLAPNSFSSWEAFAP